MCAATAYIPEKCPITIVERGQMSYQWRMFWTSALSLSMLLCGQNICAGLTIALLPVTWKRSIWNVAVSSGKSTPISSSRLVIWVKSLKQCWQWLALKRAVILIQIADQTNEMGQWLYRFMEHEVLGLWIQEILNSKHFIHSTWGNYITLVIKTGLWRK